MERILISWAVEISRLRILRKDVEGILFFGSVLGFISKGKGICRAYLQ